MKIKGLDNKEYSWNLTNHTPLDSDERPRSELHIKARELIKNTWPCCKVVEEVQLPGSGSLYADFYVPLMKTMVEVHGEQHYKLIPFFHHNEFGFAESKQRDRNKMEWCQINGITLKVLPYNRIDEWEAILDGRIAE